MAHLFGPVWGHHFLAWLQTGEGLVAVDTGWDLARGQPHEGSDLAALVAASEATGEPLRHLLLTHDHFDHVAGLPLLRERWPTLQLLAHPNSSAPDVAQPLVGGERLRFGAVEVEVIASPGHSAQADELSFYLPDEQFLFCGDVAQPQGPSYAYTTGPSPVPYFHDGTAYRRTLERLMALEVAQARTGHGDLLGPEQVRQWLRVTLATLARIEELAVQLAERYPQRAPLWIAEQLYDQVADERHFRLRAANQRKRHSSYDGQTDFERFDLPGLLWAAREALAL